MKRKRFIAIFILIIVVFSSFIGCADTSKDAFGRTVRVILPENDKFEYLGTQLFENGEWSDELVDSRVVDIPSGGSVRFAVSLDENMTIEVEGDNVTYADGYITASNVRIPTTIDVLVRSTEIAPKPKLWKINYHANGGAVSSENDNGTGIIQDTIDESFYYCPNTRPDKSYFTRDGYVLMGYNTKSDGSGDYHGLGWNIVMPENGIIDLYCQWAKVSDVSKFTYTQVGRTAQITGYNGNDDFLVIPESINGLQVTALKENAFKNIPSKEVYIPKTVKTIASNAFYNCPSLCKVYMSDSVIACNDNSFSACQKLKTLLPQATEYPHADNIINFTYQVNYERLITRKNNIMLIVSGSCNVYGLTAADVEKSLDNRWDIITYSTIASTPCTMYAEIGLHYMDENDILIFTPEASPRGHQWGTNTWEYYVWQIFEGAYDAISLVDISNYSLVFSSFSSYNTLRANTKEQSYEIYSEDLNEYGEFATYRVPKANENPWIKWNISAFFTDNNVNNFNRVLDSAKAKGIQPMIGWLACTNTYSLTNEAKNRQNQLEYMMIAEQIYHAEFFGDIADYIYDPKYVYDSAMHLTTEGCEIRTKQVAKDIREALIELGIIEEE